ncbi:hypothetical protein BLOT_005463 [Blomia tropicalis]|nr:hypothetical protein BLOT_005463 [Blomia tropicalis]
MANRPNHSLNNDQIIARPATPVPPPINRNQQQEICSTKSTDNPVSERSIMDKRKISFIANIHPTESDYTVGSSTKRQCHYRISQTKFLAD